MEALLVMEYITLLVTLLMFATGIPPCVNLYKTKDATNVPFHMFLLMTITCSGMCHYGMMKGNTTLIFLNGIGGFLQLSYLSVYLMFAQNRSRPVMFIILGVMYVCGLYYYLYNVVFHQPAIADTLGSLTSLLTTFTIVVLPFFEIVENIRKKNADGMPTVMLIGSLMCSSCWLVYGLMLEDFIIYAPNIPSLVVLLLKLAVVQIYRQPEKLKTK